MHNHYAGVFVFDPRDGYVLVVSDSKHEKELKMAGGTSFEGEEPEDTATREATEELRTKILESILVHTESVPNRDGSTHMRYFFLATKISSALEKGATWEVEEKDPTGRVVEKLIAQWVPIRVLASRLFFKQRPAFGAVLAELAKNEQFFNKYEDLLSAFPAPEVV